MESNLNNNKGRVLLAYSGGLDTSCILAWLIDQGYEVVAFMADVGQEEDFKAAEIKALKVGAKEFILKDVKREFVTELITPAVQANCIYEGVYLLGTSLARPVIARAMIEAATKEKCSFVSHGCTGKGNDQVRFELAFYALSPNIKVIAPWRLPEFYTRFAGRSDLLKYASEKGIPVVQTSSKPWSTDENLYHISYEAGILEEPDVTPPKDMWKLTKGLEESSEMGPQCIDISFTRGIFTQLIIYEPTNKNNNQQKIKSEHHDILEIFLELNKLGKEHGIGRIDIVENRFIGIKSRGCYETPGGTILRKAHMDLEGLTLDGKIRNLRDNFLTNELSKILYNGFWFSPEREFIQSCLNSSQKNVNGRVKLNLFKGNVIVIGRASNEGLYDSKESSMDEMGGFEPTDTSGFIQIESIRLKKWGSQRQKEGLGVTADDVYTK